MIDWAIAGINGAAVATGAHVAHGAGAQVAIGAAYVGGQAGAQTVAGRLNQLHGQHGHSRAQAHPEADGNAATASKINSFFVILSSPSSSGGDYCFGRVV